MKPVFLLLAFLSFHCAFAQTDTAYLDKSGKQIKKSDDVVSYRVVERLPSGLFSYNKYDAVSHRLEMTGHFRNADSIIYEGEFVYYDTLGGVHRTGRYENGEREGEWKEYYKGTTQLYLLENYEKGNREGKFFSYYESGKVKRDINYKDGLIVTGKKFAEDGKELPFTPHEVMPEADFNVNKFLSKNVRYPKKCIKEKISGRVVVRFVINEMGKIEQVETLKSVHPLIDEEAMRVVKSMPDWKPGVFDDKAVKVYFSLPIKFSLGDEAEPKRRPDILPKK